MNNTDTKIIRIAIVDDHIGMITYAAEYLQQHCPRIQVVFTVSDGQTMLEKLADPNLENPHIVIIDISMPGMDGYQATKALREDYPGIRVLIHTATQQPEAALTLIGLGVRAFVDKSSDSDVLIDAVCSLADRGYFINEYLSERLLSQLGKPSSDLPSYLLSERQQEIFRLMQAGYLDKQIAGILCIEVTTVRDHINKAKIKFAIRDRGKLMLHLSDLGLVNRLTTRKKHA